MMQTQLVLAETKPCTKCGEVKPLSAFSPHARARFGVQPACRVCDTQRQRDAYRQNPAPFIAHSAETARRWKAAHPEEARERTRRATAWRKAKNRDGRLNPEERAAVRVVQAAERRRRFNESHPGYAHAAAQKHRAMKVGAQGEASAAQIQARRDYYGGLCWVCRAPADGIDHVIPLSRGGSNWPANIRPACQPCNSRRGNRISSFT